MEEEEEDGRKRREAVRCCGFKNQARCSGDGDEGPGGGPVQDNLEQTGLVWCLLLLAEAVVLLLLLC